MSSPSAVLQRALPRVRLAPRAPESDGDDACFLSSSYGLTPDDWQEDILDDWLGRRRDGRWSAATCGLAVPRQNGKNGIIEVRELFGMIALGEKFLHTAHEVKTARKAFLRIASFFENERQYPELVALVREIRKTNGQEAIVLTNGGSCEFIARSKGSGRGYTVDVLVCDEAQDLTDEELAALLPTISAAPKRNPQVIFTGTPPDPAKTAQGEVFRRVRADGEARRDKRLAWTDYGAADGPLPDVDNRELWVVHNPALHGRLNIGEIERERALMDPHRFAAERFGWWGDPETDSAGIIDLDHWADLRNPVAKQPKRAVLAIDVAPDRRSASIGVAGAGSDGRTLLMVRHSTGTRWVVPEVAKLVRKRDIVDVILHPHGQAGALIPDLIEANIAYNTLTSTDLGQATAKFLSDIEHKALEHVGQPELDAAVGNARTRMSSEAELWDRRKPGVDISPLVAVSEASFRWASESEAEPSAFFI